MRFVIRGQTIVFTPERSENSFTPQIIRGRTIVFTPLLLYSFTPKKKSSQKIDFLVAACYLCCQYAPKVLKYDKRLSNKHKI